MKTYIVDAFTSEPFKGNPAGICFPESPLNEQQMLNIAKELGYSETAFVIPRNEKTNYDIRFFTPKEEIALCGHATLGSAKVLFSNTDLSEIHFFNINGLQLTTRRDGLKVAMEFPVYSLVPAEVPSSTLRALGIDEIVHCAHCKEVRILMLVIESENKLAQLAPDYAALVQSLQGYDGVLVTARSHNGTFDYAYRYFWPWKGTNEDPVTGGAQTFLAKFWSDQLHKRKMRAFQSSQRTGDLEVELIDNDSHVLIKGDAVVVFEGEMRINNC